jgi:hypothetical protein
MEKLHVKDDMIKVIWLNKEFEIPKALLYDKTIESDFLRQLL